MTGISKHSDAETDDEDIDFSDIPEVTPEMFENARIRAPKRSMIETPLSDASFSAEAYAALGRLLASFGALEHHLMRAVIDLRGGPDAISPDSNMEDAIEAEIGGAIKARAKTFVTTYRAEIGGNEWIDDLEATLAHACEYRDHFSHGLWRETTEGWLHCTFWQRGKKGEKPQEMVWYGPRSVLLEIAETNFANAKLLAEYAAHPAHQAAE